MNRIHFGASLLAAALAGGLIGSVATRARLSHAETSAPHSPSLAHGDASRARRPSPMTAAYAPDDTAAPGAYDRMQDRARNDPAYLRELMRRYMFETELDKRGALLAVLQGVANDDVLRLGRQLADNRDPSIRRDGLELLKAFSLEVPEVREVLSRQLQNENDPAMLKELIDMLNPAVVATEDTETLLDRLSTLRQHPDPGVRASSVLQSVQWNKTAAGEDILHRAILDPDLQVRQAAIAGITSTSTRSDRLKDALLDIANHPDTDDETLSSAVFALQNFGLNRSEYALYKKASERVTHGEEGEPHGHAH